MLSSMRRARTQPETFAAETTALICIPSRTETRAARRGCVSTPPHGEEFVRAVTADRGSDPMRKACIACGKRRAHHRLAIL